ncbi:cyclic-di-AMP phosphodiesterase GdpP [Thalassobacillus devorans]|uniref:Cyclic-di-AMP phosphodiesterase n=1 Tax=Thalassobacillus devorans TaxID=279813 RepID=A0ABQ1PDC2_9BACI|nr:DHH family phosphoesterase [Thalassobacillus devorans]NIK29220.1 c-di-AMP phosphodiesterase-like protein [Thalassobacillus devorans]GGC95043.1 cyclic-di-AMP phosphodiesterase GdpP [Thalassobacillus devorans]
MTKFAKKPKISRHFWIIYLLSIVLLAFIWYYEWTLGLLMTLLLTASIYYTVRAEQTMLHETEEYITTLSYRVKKVGEEALLEMPIGIVLFSENYRVEWTNPYMNDFSRDEETLVGQSLQELSEDLVTCIKEDKNEAWIQVGDYEFQTFIKKDERLLYLFDRTKQSEIQHLYHNEQTVLSIIFLDNYEEITQGMDDTAKSHLNSQVTSILNKWSNEYGIYLKRTSQERFLAVMNQEILNQLEKSKFEILDEVRELISNQNVPLTLSYGIGVGPVSLPELGELAQSSLDLALGRGGDQVAIKDDTGKVRFYGGKTNPMEKRTRVRARVISHALKELVKESDRVLIMGHKAPDMDAVGAAIGILKIAQANEKEGFIVMDEDEIDTGVDKMIDEVREDDELWSHFISREDALDMVNTETLLVVVDTHKPSMVVEEKLLSKTEHVVVIDHHRRAEEFISDPTLVYMEPYASSTAELVTELLEYQPKKLKLSMLEATALLSGIIVDTKSFTLRTGSRTFDAASYLRSKGADTILVQKFMKEDLNIYVRRSQLIERAEIYRDGVAIATGNEGETYGPVLIAQAADTLLTMSGVVASFVISERKDGRIGISARSLGDVNVQVVMERMNGGGHLTNAATQLEDTTINDAKALLQDIIDEYFEGGTSE